MEVEYVTGVRLAARGAAQQQRYLPVGNGLLGEIVVNDQRGTTRIAEVLADGGTGEGSVELQRSGLRSGGGDDDGVIHGSVLFQCLSDLGYGAGLLSAGYVDTVHGFPTVVEFPLVEDGVDGDGGLTRLPVTDDELPLATSDGDHGINGLYTSL